VAQNSAALQEKLAERQKLLSQLDQAKMQEQVNAAMTSLTETVGQDSPSLEEVRAKIEARYARALGSAELAGATVEARMLEVQHAQNNAEAAAKLAQIKTQLGISAAEPASEIASAEAGQEVAQPDKS
jgi:phage shock protein A